MNAEEAINVAQLWRAGKMIGADEDEVRDALLDECLRLRKLTKGWSGYGWKDGEYMDDLQEYFDSAGLSSDPEQP
jgi:hypothetical protein